MRLIGISENGQVLNITMEETNENANELLGATLIPPPMYLGKVGGVQLRLINKNQIAFSLKVTDLPISTNYVIKETEDGDKFLTPSWGSDGFALRLRWKPSMLYKLILCGTITTGENGYGAVNISMFMTRNNIIYAPPLKNIGRCGTMCTGTGTSELFAKSAYEGYGLSSPKVRFENIHKIEEYVGASTWNNDLGSCTVEEMQNILRWDLNGNQLPALDHAYDALCEIEKREYLTKVAGMWI